MLLQVCYSIYSDVLEKRRYRPKVTGQQQHFVMLLQSKQTYPFVALIFCNASICWSGLTIKVVMQQCMQRVPCYATMYDHKNCYETMYDHKNCYAIMYLIYFVKKKKCLISGVTLELGGAMALPTFSILHQKIGRAHV